MVLEPSFTSLTAAGFKLESKMENGQNVVTVLLLFPGRQSVQAGKLSEPIPHVKLL